MTKYKFFLLVGVLLCGLMLTLAATQNVAAASHVVNNIGDGGDATPGDGVCETGAGNGTCTLRAAIQEANAATGPDTITFDSSIGLIIPNDKLPALDDASGGTTIKGNPTWIMGTNAGVGIPFDGLTLLSDGNKIQGLWITDFDGDGLQVEGDNNIIGVDGDGIDDADEGNMIIGNGAADSGGIFINGGSGNWVAGNLIGLDYTGSSDAGNTHDGVLLYNGAHDNLIGTNGDGTSDLLERNVIAGNGWNGVYLNASNNNVIAGNYIGTNAVGDAAIPNGLEGMRIIDSTNNRIGTDGDGSSDDLEGNLISGNGENGIWLYESSNNVVAGNTIGTNAAGDAAISNAFGGIDINKSSNNRIGTDADGVSDELERNLVSGNVYSGIVIGSESDGNVVAGNYIGTNAAGDAAIPNEGHGVSVGGNLDPDNNRIGGTSPTERNLISGNGRDGVRISGAGLNNLVKGNYIGTDASGSGSLGNGWNGVTLFSTENGSIVGGTASGAANRIAYNTIGIRVIVAGGVVSFGNNLRGNAIFSNGGLGIDLQPEEGVTPNDPGDADDGANHLQNFPVLSAAESDASQIVIVGALNSISNTTFTVDFYANSACDPSGYGEGEIYLGAETVTTDGSGDASFTASLPISVTVGYSLTATATDPGGTTSEFSQCQGVTALEPRLLTAYLGGAGSGAVTSDPTGISCPGDCDELYDYGTLVTLSAGADSGSIFNGWSGACTGTGDCTVTITETQSVTATFDLLPPGEYALAVSLAGDGEGTVSGSGIACFAGSGADCSEAFMDGTVVTLTASADAGSLFTGWGGAGCSGIGDCVVTMTANQSVTATFAPVGSEIKIFLPLTLR